MPPSGRTCIATVATAPSTPTRQCRYDAGSQSKSTTTGSGAGIFNTIQDTDLSAKECRLFRTGGDPEPLEGRGVAEAEAVEPTVAGDDPHGAPRGHGDEIAPTDREAVGPGLEDPRALEHLPDRRTDLAAGRGARPGKEAVHLEPQCRERVPARRRVHEPDRGVPRPDHARVAVGVELELGGERGVRVVPPVRGQRRPRPVLVPRLARGSQPGMRPEALRARGGGSGAVGWILGAVLEELGVERADERH